MILVCNVVSKWNCLLSHTVVIQPLGNKLPWSYSNSVKTAKRALN